MEHFSTTVKRERLKTMILHPVGVVFFRQRGDSSGPKNGPQNDKGGSEGIRPGAFILRSAIHTVFCLPPAETVVRAWETGASAEGHPGYCPWTAAGNRIVAPMLEHQWGKEAFERFPELIDQFDQVESPYQLWIELMDAFRKAYETPRNEDLISRIYAYADWCCTQPEGATAE